MLVNLKRTTPFLLGVSACLLLSACQTTKSANTSGGVDSAVERAQNAAGGEAKSLAAAERAYKKDPEDALAATDYARALREQGAYDQAAAVLEPFTKGKNALS